MGTRWRLRLASNGGCLPCTRARVCTGKTQNCVGQHLTTKRDLCVCSRCRMPRSPSSSRSRSRSRSSASSSRSRWVAVLLTFPRIRFCRFTHFYMLLRALLCISLLCQVLLIVKVILVNAPFPSPPSHGVLPAASLCPLLQISWAWSARPRSLTHSQQPFSRPSWQLAPRGNGCGCPEHDAQHQRRAH